MRHRFRLAIAAGAILASAATSVLLFANTGWAGSVPARAGDPQPSSTSNPTPNDPPPSDPAPTPSSGPTATGGPTPPEQELPCEGGAAWDDINGSWRPWFGCDDWIFVMEGRFDDRETAMKIGTDQAYIQGKARTGRVKDGPGCLPPLILC